MGLQYTKIQCNAFDIVRMRHAQLFYCRPYTFKTISSLTKKSQLCDWFSKQLFRFPSCSNCLLLQLTSPLYASAAHPMGRGAVALCLRVVRPSVRTCVHNRAVAFSDRLAVDCSLISHNHKVTVWACYKAPFPMAVRDLHRYFTGCKALQMLFLVQLRNLLSTAEVEAKSVCDCHISCVNVLIRRRPL